MGRSRRGKQSRRPQGFSGHAHRPVTDMLLRGVGAHGSNKRHFLNELSGNMVIGAAITGAVGGYIWFGILGAVFGLIVAGGAMRKFVVRNRYYR